MKVLFNKNHILGNQGEEKEITDGTAEYLKRMGVCAEPEKKEEKPEVKEPDPEKKEINPEKEKVEIKTTKEKKSNGKLQ